MISNLRFCMNTALITLRRLVPIFLALALFACGRDKNDTSSVPNISLDEVTDSQLECESGSSCHPAVGMVASATHEGPARTCVGFLATSHQVVTAANCLPIDLRHKGADCSNQVS